MAKKKGKGRSVKRARQKYGLHFESDEIRNAPHTMVIERGNCDKNTRLLVKDLRQVMEPYTAASLKSTKHNCLKDFVAIAGPLHVTHLIVLNESTNETNSDGFLRLIRLPRGPTLHFKIEEFSLCKDVVSSLKKPQTNKKQYLHQPLLILNGFNQTADDSNKSNHFKLMSTMFQNMFASINVTKCHLGEIKRCVLFNYNSSDDTIDFRHYSTKLSPVGLSKPVKKLVQEKIPNLANFQDISEFMEKGGNLSESEFEVDTLDNQVTLPEDINSKGSINLKNTKSAIRLIEIGPRLKLKLIKIQEGINEGEVLYHSYITKTPEELKEIREKLKLNKNQHKTARKKLDDHSEHEGKSGKSRRKNNYSAYQNDRNDENDDMNDDLEYYKKEVGNEPDADFYNRKTNKNKRKRRDGKEADDFDENQDYNNAQKQEDDDQDYNDEDNQTHNKKQKLVNFVKDKKPVLNKRFFRMSSKKKESLKK